MSDEFYIQKAITKARESVATGGFPAGAIIVKNGEVVGEGISVGNMAHDPTSHGEMAAVRDACKNLSTSDLSGTILYASMEPCSMCHSAAMWSSISKIVFACSKEKVSNEYYGGSYKTDTLNNSFNRPIELVHFVSSEEESLEVVKGWEANFA